MTDIEVREIQYQDTLDFLLNKHYAQRIPSISWAFGLFLDGGLEGVCTIGRPASRPLCVGLLGEAHASKVYELNRLVTNPGLPENTLSRFVGRVLRRFRNEDVVLVSFADDGVGHQGYIYQATNFIYTGRTAQRTDKYMPGNKHPRHYTDEFKHLRKVRTPKHRYVWFSRKTKCLRGEMRYPEMPYPKKHNRRYVLGERAKTKIINRETGEEFYE